MGSVGQRLFGGDVRVVNIAVHAPVMTRVARTARVPSSRGWNSQSLILTCLMTGVVSVLVVAHSGIDNGR